MMTCTRRVQFAIGHRVHGHEGKCQHLHGHNFVFLLTAQRKDLSTDDIGRVVDFSVLKDLVGGWIEKHWDHGMVLWEWDTLAVAAMRDLEGQKLFLLPTNPTAENLAQFVLSAVGPLVLKETHVRLVKVQVWETENGMAEVTAP